MSEIKDIRKSLANSILEYIDKAYWVGNNEKGTTAYIVCFLTETDKNGSNYYLEVEYRVFEKKFVYTIVFDDGRVLEDSNYLNDYWKKQIEEHILSKVTDDENNTTIIRKVVSYEFILEVEKNSTVGELTEWLGNVSINSVDTDEIKLLSYKQK